MADEQRETVYTLTIREQVTAALQKVIAQLQQLEAQASKSIAAPTLDKAAAAAEKTADNVDKVTTNAKAASEQVRGVADNTATADKSAGSLAQKWVDIFGRTSKVFITLKAVVVVTNVLEAGWEAVKAAIAASTGEVEKQVAAQNAAVELIEKIPIVGKDLVELGRSFQRFENATANLFTGQGFETDETKAAAIAKQTALVEKHTAKLKEEAEAQKHVVDQTKALTTSLRNEAASLLLTQEDQAFRNIDETKKQIDELLKKEPNVDRFGTPTAAGQALQNFRDNYVSKLSQFYRTEYTQKAEAADVELQAARLEGTDRTNEAELVKLKQSLHERELEMGKSSAKEAQQSERLNAQVLANFTRNAAEVRERIGREFSVDLEQRNLQAQGTLQSKQAADRAALNLKQQLEVIDTLKKLRGAGVDEEGVNFAKDLLTDTQAAERRALERDQTFDSATHSIDRLSQHQGDLNFQIERTARLYEDGKLTLTDVSEQQRRDIAAVGGEVERVSAEIDGDLAKGILTDEQAEELKRRLAGVREEVERTRTETQKLASGLQNDTANAISQFAQSAVKDIRHVGDAFTTLLGNLADSILKLETDALAKSIVNKFSGGESGGGIFGSIVSGIGSIFSFSSGGFVPGVGSGDSVPAMLTPGEAVIPRRVVEGLGHEFIGRLIGFRRQAAAPQLPLHFATGGVVPQVGAQGSRAPAVALATVIAGNQEAERFFKGGHTAITRYFAQHASLYRAILGVNG